MPSGASRMTHHRAFCSSSRIDSLRARIGWAFSPSWRAAIPATAAMKTIWSTFSSVNGVMTSVGTMPVRKSSQEPVFSGSSPSFGVSPVPAPGLVTSPMARPMATAISDVIMNQRRVRLASRAALLTFRRLVIETRIAKKTSGATASFSSPTKTSPIFSRAVTSQDTSWLRAIQPSAAPRRRPMSIWAQKGALNDFVFADTDAPVGTRRDTWRDERRGGRRQRGQIPEAHRPRSTCRRATSTRLGAQGDAAAVFTPETLTPELWVAQSLSLIGRRRSAPPQCKKAPVSEGFGDRGVLCGVTRLTTSDPAPGPRRRHGPPGCGSPRSRPSSGRP
ncbi:hypothetical protein SGLAM104S_01021 [Streptomyces glaucescens]